MTICPHVSPADQVPRDARRPGSFWLDIDNQKDFLNRVAKELDVQQVCFARCRCSMLIHFCKITDWYKVYKKDLISRGGAGLFNYYNTLESALRVVYPGVEWSSSSFIENCRAPRGYWKQAASRRSRFDKIGKKLGITKVLNCVHSVF